MRRIVTRAVAWSLAGWLAWRLFGPDPVPSTEGPQRRPLRVPGRSVFVGRHEFFVRELGDLSAPPLLLIHGWNFDSEMAFHKVAPRLADRYRVVIPDLRNHGKSDRIRGRFEIADVADEMRALIEVLGLPAPLPVVGYSMGGMVAQELAMRHPDVVGSLVLAATAARPMHRFRPAIGLALILTRAVARVSRAEAVWASFNVMRRRGLIDAADEAWMWDSLLARDANLYYEAAFAMWRFDARDRVGRITAPTLIVIPTADTLMPVAAQEELAATMPDAAVVRLEGLGHEAILAVPDELAEIIDEFASRHRRVEP